MITRTVKFQLLAFLLISLLGVSYVSFNYVGLGSSLFGPGGCTVSANFPDSGGIFTNAEVTYRGVTVGKVGELHLLDYTDSSGTKVHGVRVDLRLNDCGGKNRIPLSSQAYVSDRSAVGEQYVNLEPSSKAGPYATSGSVLSTPGQVPIATQVLLANLDNLVSNIDSAKLNTVITELGKAFSGRGPDLQALLDSGDQLLAAAQQALPETLRLIDNSGSVLQTQLDKGSAIKAWAHNLNLISAQLRSSDPDLNALLSQGPSELQTVQQFVATNSDGLHVLLANMVSTNQVLVAHLQGIEAILLLYPAAVAGSYTVAPGDGTAHFGLVLNVDDPPSCVDGYGGTTKRQPSDTGPAPVNTNAQCTLGSGSKTEVRGAQNAPGGDPISTGGGGAAYPRVTPGQRAPVSIGGTGTASDLLGDQSWLPLLTGGLK
ncbi:MCE family protein [Jatrophihabitans telluris]|uniref:MCE family protein n=1 Tax=Jatrophihabitans telluris TaxID=2038343 RepID=A0ABY4QWV8_9ACTN|nr:MlaD family protein [Jatrophihabitans telluris]UQX88015.1 MCE family protein [Jatrophihabitans telluris]